MRYIDKLLALECIDICGYSINNVIIVCYSLLSLLMIISDDDDNNDPWMVLSMHKDVRYAINVEWDEVKYDNIKRFNCSHKIMMI